MFQKIFNSLAPFLPDEWETVVFMAAYFDASYSMEFYALKNGRYIDCHNLGYNQIQLINLYNNIHKAIKLERNCIGEDKLWHVMTMTIERNSGDFRVEYDYEDIPEHFESYRKAWKKKYLV